MSDDEEAEEVEEDGRIAKLYSKADKATPEEFAALVDELGTKDAIVYGSMCTDHPTARAHFVVMSLIDLDDGSLAEVLEARWKVLKAVVAADKNENGGKELIAALEGLICTASEAIEASVQETAKSDFGKALKVLWEREVVSEEQIKAWQEDERAGRHYRVSTADAQRLHEAGREFVEWTEHGEEDY